MRSDAPITQDSRALVEGISPLQYEKRYPGEGIAVRLQTRPCSIHCPSRSGAMLPAPFDRTVTLLAATRVIFLESVTDWLPATSTLRTRMTCGPGGSTGCTFQ